MPALKAIQKVFINVISLVIFVAIIYGLAISAIFMGGLASVIVQNPAGSQTSFALTCIFGILVLFIYEFKLLVGLIEDVWALDHR